LLFVVLGCLLATTCAVNSYSGYVTVNKQYGANLFYYFIESNLTPKRIQSSCGSKEDLGAAVYLVALLKMDHL